MTILKLVAIFGVVLGWQYRPRWMRCKPLHRHYCPCCGYPSPAEDQFCDEGCEVAWKMSTGEITVPAKYLYNDDLPF